MIRGAGRGHFVPAAEDWKAVSNTIESGTWLTGRVPFFGPAQKAPFAREGCPHDPLRALNCGR